MDGAKWELVHICRRQMSDARRSEGKKRGGAATPVAGQEPKSTAGRLATGAIRPASGTRVIIHTGRKKKKKKPKACTSGTFITEGLLETINTEEAPPPHPTPPPGALAR